jgi:hypothetical protein
MLKCYLERTNIKSNKETVEIIIIVFIIIIIIIVRISNFRAWIK